MRRRDFVKWSLGAASMGLVPWEQALAAPTGAIQGGWIDDPVARQLWVKSQALPFLTQQNQAIRESGKGQIALLYKYFEEVTKSPLIPHRQTAGDCIGHGFGLGVDILSTVQMLMHGKPERWIAKAATEIIYGGSRVEVGGGRLRRGDGSLGIWAAEFVKEWGILQRKRYMGGRYDFTEYSGTKAREMGRSGVPDELEPLCKLHPVKTVSICRTWEECRDAVANGYPVAMCSNVGFRTRGGRDKDGFLSPGRRHWNHCMLIAGIDDSYRRPGGLLINSWGTWTYGPKRHGQPEGSFWADASVINRAMRQGDSFALSGYLGYPRIDLDYRFW